VYAVLGSHRDNNLPGACMKSPAGQQAEASTSAATAAGLHCQQRHCQHRWPQQCRHNNAERLAAATQPQCSNADTAGSSNVAATQNGWRQQRSTAGSSNAACIA
jgi:hypothetical protein